MISIPAPRRGAGRSCARKKGAWAQEIYALALALHARFDEALERIRLAQQLDPAYILFMNDMVAILYLARRYDEAIFRAR